jgi:hypothetical protein
MAKLPRAEKLFEGRRFDREIIVLCVRPCLRFKLRAWDEIAESRHERIRTGPHSQGSTG